MLDRKIYSVASLCMLILLCRCTMGSGSEQETSAGGEVGREPVKASQESPAAREVSALQGSRGVHRSPIAGSWYPEDPERLRRLLKDHLKKVPAPDPTATSQLIAVIVPHAGYTYSGLTAAHAYKAIRQRNPKRILLIGPSHDAPFRGVSFGDYATYETPLGRVPVDGAGREMLMDCPLVGFHPDAHEREHCLDIQVPFLQVIFPESTPSLLPLLVGNLEEEDYPVLAGCLRKVLDAETVVVVSSDFTHYGPRYGYMPFPYEEGVAAKIRHLDQGACDKVLNIDRKGFLTYYETTGITICGCRPIALLLELLPKDTESRNLSYTTSGRLTGDYRNSVSYASVAFTRNALWDAEAEEVGRRPEGETTMRKGKNPSQGTEAYGGSLTPSERATLLRIARDTVEEYVRKRKTPDLASGRYDITPALREHCGAFVTLKEHGELRGCIGYIQPIEPLFETVQQNAINAATRDSRFAPVKAKELSSIEIEISVLTIPTTVSSFRDIILGKHGIILKKGSHQAVFLPQVAPEQGWDLPETLRHLSLKAGLTGDAWKDPQVEFRVFTAEVFQEE